MCLTGQALTVWNFSYEVNPHHRNSKPFNVCTIGLSPRGGTCQNFDKDARPIFWVSNLAKFYFSGLANFLAIFLGFAKFQLFFWV